MGYIVANLHLTNEDIIHNVKIINCETAIIPEISKIKKQED